MGFPTTPLDEGTTNHSLCLRVKRLIPKTQRETNNPLIWDCLPLTLMKGFIHPPVTALLGIDVEYQVDKTQSTRFELIDYEDELKYASDDDVFEAKEEMYEDI
ncbi:hypothetical protein Tco_0862775 [Tanacetum coccineum]